MKEMEKIGEGEEKVQKGEIRSEIEEGIKEKRIVF